MLSKTVLFVVAAVFALQGVTVDGFSFSLPTISSSSLCKDAVNKSKELEAQINETIQHLVQNATQLAANITSKINETTQPYLEKVQEVADQVETQIDEVIEQLEKQAASTGENATSCLDLVSEGGKTIAANLTLEAGKCVKDEIQKGVAIIYGLVNIANDANSTLNEASEEMDACRNKNLCLQIITCSTSVVTTTGVKEGILAGKAATLAATVPAYFTALKTDIEMCLAGKVATIPVQIFNLVKQIPSCSQNKTNSG